MYLSISIPVKVIIVFSHSYNRVGHCAGRTGPDGVWELGNLQAPHACLEEGIRSYPWLEPRSSIDRSWMATAGSDGETLQTGAVALGYTRSDRWSYAQ